MTPFAWGLGLGWLMGAAFVVVLWKWPFSSEANKKEGN